MTYGHVCANREVVNHTVRSRGGRAAVTELATARPPHLSTGHALRPTRLLLLLLLHLGEDEIARLRQRRLRVLLVALQILLPSRLADHELLESERVRTDRLARRELLAHRERPVRHPRRRALLPLRPHRLVRRELAGRPAHVLPERVLPDAQVVGEEAHVVGGQLLVLSVLEQRRAGVPEHRPAGAP